MDLKIAGESMLVTGGTRGIGREIALTFAREGARVAVCGRDPEQVERTVEELRDAGADAALGVAADLVRAEECGRVVDETVAAFGGLRGLVCSAATGAVTDLPRQVEQMSDAQLLDHVHGKTMPAVRCTQAAIPYMRAKGAGAIVYIVGTASRQTTRGRENHPHEPAMLQTGLGCAMLTNFSKQVGEQIAGDGILVNVVHPHTTAETARFARRIKARAAALALTEEEAAADMGEYVPLGRIFTPRDLAPLTVFLCSPLAGAITGQTIAVDGGACRTVVY